MSRPLRRVAVFCGSSNGFDPAYVDGAHALGAHLAESGIGLVYGGGRVGLMGAVANAVMAGGGEVLGVITEQLLGKEVGHTTITELQVVHSMHERKLAMADAADAFIALPGGVGTFEELFEVLTWTQLGIHDKPVGLLDVGGYYAPLLSFLDATVTAGFVREGHRAFLHDDTDPAALLAKLAAWEPVDVPKWLDLDQR